MKCLKKELSHRNIKYKSELIVPVEYLGEVLNTELRVDFFVENILPVELKAVENVIPVHEVQLLPYMKLLKAPKGIMINFNAVNLYKEGQKTFVNDLFRDLPEY